MNLQRLNGYHGTEGLSNREVHEVLLQRLSAEQLQIGPLLPDDLTPLAA